MHISASTDSQASMHLAKVQVHHLQITSSKWTPSTSQDAHVVPMGEKPAKITKQLMLMSNAFSKAPANHGLMLRGRASVLPCGSRNLRRAFEQHAGNYTALPCRSKQLRQICERREENCSMRAQRRHTCWQSRTRCPGARPPRSLRARTRLRQRSCMRVMNEPSEE